MEDENFKKSIMEIDIERLKRNTEKLKSFGRLSDNQIQNMESLNTDIEILQGMVRKDNTRELLKFRNLIEEYNKLIIPEIQNQYNEIQGLKVNIEYEKNLHWDRVFNEFTFCCSSILGGILWFMSKSVVIFFITMIIVYVVKIVNMVLDSKTKPQEYEEILNQKIKQGVKIANKYNFKTIEEYNNIFKNTKETILQEFDIWNKNQEVMKNDVNINKRFYLYAEDYPIIEDKINLSDCLTRNWKIHLLSATERQKNNINNKIEKARYYKQIRIKQMSEQMIRDAKQNMPSFLN